MLYVAIFFVTTFLLFGLFLFMSKGFAQKLTQKRSLKEKLVKELEYDDYMVQKIIQLRKAKKVSPDELANTLGFDPSYIKRIESGKMRPSKEHVELIIRSLHHTV